MPTRKISEVLRHLRSAALRAEGAELTDAQLLEYFVSGRDTAALEALVRRHGPMVWGICCRIIRDPHDAEDAFQATFLVLVRKAAAVHPRELVGNWLYGVAHQTARRARANRAKRRLREVQGTTLPEPSVTDPEMSGDLQPLLDQVLSRLPDRYRAAVVLCDLEGTSRKEAARQLGVPEGTVGSRLARGRVLLARRLARHGLAVSGGALAALLSQEAAAVPAPVLLTTIKAVTAVAAGQSAARAASGTAVALAEGVLRAMLLTKLKVALAGLLLTAGLTAGAGLVYRAQAGQPSQLGRDNVQTPGVSKTNTPGKVDAPKLIRIGANLEAIDVENRMVTLTVARKLVKGHIVDSQLANIWVSKDAKIRMGDKEAKLADLRPRCGVWVRLGELNDGFQIVEIEVMRKKAP